MMSPFRPIPLPKLLSCSRCEKAGSHAAHSRAASGVDVKVVRRMLDPRHRTAASRIGAALHELGRELVVETHVPETVR